eukprot:CAMPEP_0184494338 /NCGR_PEP_ID=MMETSP0113_2-20130426/28476_1 /TAXON_ID=91329 /ORGANISM="Norrisiella sphaerica, Strain BC52" /LENGTH=48 /DNA_ID= /DNA_START= /DNA_END= /DNA_ORIENTATION=
MISAMPRNRIDQRTDDRVSLSSPSLGTEKPLIHDFVDKDLPLSTSCIC